LSIAGRRSREGARRQDPIIAAARDRAEAEGGDSGADPPAGRARAHSEPAA
jgi:hypothetical protein